MSSSACRSAGPKTARSSCSCTGSPTTAAVWDRVVDDLERDHRVATYDVRGAGESTAPSSRSGYKMSRLVDDLVAVLDEVAPDGRPVHLVGHDWGSVQLWGAVMRESADARLRGRIASFTSISGPGLDLFGHFLRNGLRQRRFGAVGRQLLHSWYAAAVPGAVRARAGVLAARRTHPGRAGEASSSTATGTTTRSATTPATASTSTAPTGSTSAARPPPCPCS